MDPMHFDINDDDNLSVMGIGGEGTDTELSDDFNHITWWSTASYRSVHHWVFDTLSWPATSCECERVFSSAKKLITPEMNSLHDDTIEAVECLKAWFDKDFVQREEIV